MVNVMARSWNRKPGEVLSWQQVLPNWSITIGLKVDLGSNNPGSRPYGENQLIDS
jgi:hypothetical protein